jgi:hypothetical protein
MLVARVFRRMATQRRSTIFSSLRSASGYHVVTICKKLRERVLTTLISLEVSIAML